MTEYWKSNERKYCDFCKCWITDNKSSVSFHENGKRHKANVAQRITDISISSAKSEKEKQKMDMEIRKMEDAAMRSYARDICSAGDMTARSINSVMSIASTSSVGPRIEPTRPSGQIDPMRLPGNSDDEDDDNRPTVRKIASSQADVVAEGSMWVEGKSDEGHTYYWNVRTNESVWVEPKEGYMKLEEYNKINQIALAQQEIHQKEEAKSFRSNVNEEVAKFNRERLKMFRKKDPEEKAKKEKRETFKTEEDAVNPAMGEWQVVEKKPEAPPVDYQLPVCNYYVPQVVSDIVPEPPVKRFKEKTIVSLDPSLAAGASTSFKKRKFAGRGNARQRLDDDE